MDTMATTGVSFQVETLSDRLWSELEPLLAKHWHEVETEQDFPPLPDRDQYHRIEACGMLKIYVARTTEEGSLVGYLAAFVCGALHSKGVTVATGDLLFFDPEYRGHGYFKEMVRFVKSHLRVLGVQKLYLHGKHRPDVNIGAALHRMGFSFEEEVWSVRLDKE